MNAASHPPPPRIETRIDSHPAQIAALRKSIEQFAAEAGLDEPSAAELGLCVNEALANVIRHAYGGHVGQPVLVTAENVSDSPLPAIAVTIRDWGNGVNPAELPPKPHDPLTPGGIGLICLRTLMDEVSYSPQPDGMLMTMVKRRRS